MKSILIIIQYKPPPVFALVVDETTEELRPPVYDELSSVDKTAYTIYQTYITKCTGVTNRVNTWPVSGKHTEVIEFKNANYKKGTLFYCINCLEYERLSHANRVQFIGGEASVFTKFEQPAIVAITDDVEKWLKENKYEAITDGLE